MNPIQFVDTTVRDGNQSLWAAGMRTDMILPVIGQIDSAGYVAIELFTAAFIKKMVRELKEDPWERLAALRSRDDEGTAGAGEAGADVATVLADAAGAPVVENIDPNAARGADAALFVCADSAADLDALD